MTLHRLTLLALLFSIGCSRSAEPEARTSTEAYADDGEPAVVESGVAATVHTVSTEPPPEPMPISAQEEDEPFQVEEGVEVLQRGPIHEAFAAPVVFDPEPGLVVNIAPPDPIEELPPEEKPEGDDVDWIPGYWSWEDDSNDFIWISGIWRNIPPGRQWVPGYWRQVEDGYQWVSGFWTAAEQNTRVAYLPEPPANLDVGPSSEPPSTEHVYVPGTWLWHEEHYVWRPGYWVVQPAEWVWVPARYVWTPGGCVFLDGYWDYAPEYRGLLFAPVRFERVVYTRPAYVYTPRAVVDINIAIGHCFARPSYRHYYFGDYYEKTYLSIGIFPGFSFHYSRYGYDPIYSHRLVIHRHRPEWVREVRRVYFDRVEHAHLRPHRTYVRGGTSVNVNVNISRENRIVRPLSTAVRSRAYGWNYTRIESSRRTEIAHRSREIRDYSSRRREIEVSGLKERNLRRPVNTTARSVDLPSSPIRDRVSRSSVRDDDRGRVVRRGDERGAVSERDNRMRPIQRGDERGGDDRGRVTERGGDDRGRVTERGGDERRGRIVERGERGDDRGRSSERRTVERGDDRGRATQRGDDRGRAVQRGDDRGRAVQRGDERGRDPRQDARSRTQQPEGRSGRIVERSGAEDRRGESRGAEDRGAGRSSARSRFGAPPRNPTPPTPDAKVQPRSDAREGRPEPRRVIERRPADRDAGGRERSPRRP